MTTMSNKARGQFLSLKISAANAIGAAYDRETEAIQAGDNDTADQIYAERRKLENKLAEIRKAEIAYLLSEKGVHDAEAILQRQTEAAQRALKRLNGVATAIEGLASIVRIVTGLAALF